MRAIGISSSGRKSAYSKIIVKDILYESKVEYGEEARKQAEAIGKILGSILNARQ